MTDCALRASGLVVGRYTSPHLIKLEERFAVDGTPVDTATFVELAERMRRLIDDLLAKGSLESPPTFFEVTTAIAFEMFRRAHVDVAVLEVGLGGRLDSTNIVQPIAAAIASIDSITSSIFRHTLAAIAAEKAGIISATFPSCVGPAAGRGREVSSRVQLAGAEFVEADAGVRLDSTNDDGEVDALQTPTRDYGWVRLGLRGDHRCRTPWSPYACSRHCSAATCDGGGDYRRHSRWVGRDGCRCSKCPAAAACCATPPIIPRARGRSPASEARVSRTAPIRIRALRDKDVTLMLKTCCRRLRRWS